MANRVDPDETARYEPSHLNLHCLPKHLCWYTGLTLPKQEESRKESIRKKSIRKKSIEKKESGKKVSGKKISLSFMYKG